MKKSVWIPNETWEDADSEGVSETEEGWRYEKIFGLIDPQESDDSEAEEEEQDKVSQESLIFYGARFIPNYESLETEAIRSFYNAAEKGYASVLEFHIDAHPTIIQGIIDRPDARSNTPLHLAALSGKVDAVRILIEKGKANVNALTKYNRNALHNAALIDNLAIAELLVASGVKLYQKDLDERTPLDLAKLEKFKPTETTNFLAMKMREHSCRVQQQEAAQLKQSDTKNKKSTNNIK